MSSNEIQVDRTTSAPAVAESNSAGSGEETAYLSEISSWSRLSKFLRNIDGYDPATIEQNDENDENTTSTTTIWKVPDRLKEASVLGPKDCCFAPKVVAIGLHSLSFFDESKFQLKFNIAKRFAEQVYLNSQPGERWGKLVKDIVGSKLGELMKEYDPQGFTKWKGESLKSSPKCAIEEGYFALLLAVDAVFLVECLESKKDKITALSDADLLAEEKDKDEFLKWDLNLVENQIPLTLLREVVQLKNQKSKHVKSPASGIVKHHSTFEDLIQRAVWMSYPFLSDDSERYCCDDFLACCCPCEPGGETPQEAVEMDPDSEFSRDWEDTYKNSCKEDSDVKYAHILDWTYHVSSRQRRSAPPAEVAKYTSVVNIPQDEPDKKLQKADKKIATDRNTKVFDIPPATYLQDAGVKIRGTASGLASSSLITINIWTIICSLLCTLTCIRCCLCSSSRSSCTSFSSCASRWRATLKLPTVKMYKETSRMLRNVATYEQLMDGNGRFRHYIRTMRSLALGKKDVMLLIRSGVIQSQLAGPRDVIQSWKDMDNGLNLAPLGEPWAHLQRNLEEHRKNRFKRWYALPTFWLTNCSNPLVLCSFIVVVSLALFSGVNTYVNVVKAVREKTYWWN